MALTDNRLLPLASIQLFDTGEGDPIVTDRGNAYYDLIRDTWPFGTFSQDEDGNTPLEFMPQVGLLCRPQIVLQDNLLEDYLLGDGDWESRAPRVGASPTYRLCQLDNTPGILWAAQSIRSLPRNPTVVFSFEVGDNPPDLDADLFPPFYQVEFGQDDSGQAQWALRFSRDDGNQLCRWLGTWVSVKDLGSPPQEIAGEGEEFLVILRCVRGGIYVSLDFGFSYVEFHFASQEVAGGSALPDSGLSATGVIPIVVPPSPFTFRGLGGQAVLGVHQVAMSAGRYRSADRNTFTSRSLLATATAAPVGYAPEGTSIDCVDDGDPVGQDAAYLATLTPAIVGYMPWPVYASPELYAVKLTYPVVTAAGAGTYTTPFDETTGGHQTSGAGIVSVDIEKPYELDGATAKIQLRRDPSVNFTWASARWAKLRIRLGYLLVNGSTTWFTVFTGYCKRPRAGMRAFNEADLVLELENASIRFRRAKWTEFDSIPLGGFTPNQALDYILYTEGLDASYRLWDPAGDAFPLPTGLPEDPFEYPRKGEPKWDTMRRIAGYAGLELGVLDNGAFATVVKQWVDTNALHVLQAVPATNLPAMIQDVSFGLDASESATAILVRGTDFQTLLPVWGWAADKAAEQDKTSPRFCPWREWVFDEIPGTVSPAFLTLRAQTLAYEHFSMKWEADTTAEVDLAWARRDMAQVQGANVGILNTDAFVILTLQHHYEADPSFAKLVTNAGMRRL